MCVRAQTSIDMLRGVGKKTRCIARFSTIMGEKGSPDSARDPRGFSVKFYTEEGNWDWVFNNTPVFFLRDPAKFPIFIHTQKRNPQTNLKDATMFWDYLSTHQESAHQVIQLFSDRGTPYSYRHMHGYSGHTYKFTRPDGSFHYVKIHCHSDQGSKAFTHAEAAAMATENPDWHTQDLFDAIDAGRHPSWTCYLQVLAPEAAERFHWNIFDITKVWPHAEVPLRPFGRLTLNRNTENYFADIEQLAFSPSHMVPGVEPSADPVLQSRLFSYPDTHRHRLGVNYQQIPVNRPLHAFSPYQRDGTMAINGNYGANPNYPSTYRAMTYKPVKPSQEHEKWAGAAVAQQLPVTDEDFVQPRRLWAHVLARQPGQQDRLVANVAIHLAAAQPSVRRRTYIMFARIEPDLGRRVETETEQRVEQRAAPPSDASPLPPSPPPPDASSPPPPQSEAAATDSAQPRL